MNKSDLSLKAKPRQEDYAFSDRLVSFIDILGFKELVFRDKSTSVQTINIIDSNLSHILNVLKEYHGKVFSTKLFSDCICVSCDYSTDNVFYILYELAFIQFYLAQSGIFLRGALSRGLHFENERLIFSQGLISAYNLEQIAKYPRIIVDKDIANDILSDNKDYFPIYISFKKRDFLTESPDGQFFVDYLHILFEEGMEQLEELTIHKEAILSNLKKNINNVKVVDKYRWVSEYHNTKFKDFFSKDECEKDHSGEVIDKITINFKKEFTQFKKLQ